MNTNANLIPRILIIDDNPAIHDDFRKILDSRSTVTKQLNAAAAALFGHSSHQTEEMRCEIDSALRGQEGLDKVRAAVREGRPYSMAYVDARMPNGWDGIETICHVWEEHPDLLVVICTAFSDYSWEKIQERLGYSDRFLILKKPFDNLEVRQLTWALIKRARTERELHSSQQEVRIRTLNLERAVTELKQSSVELQEARDAALTATKELQQLHRQHALVLNAVGEGIHALDLEGRIIFENPTAAKMLGWKIEELVGQPAHATIHHSKVSGEPYPQCECPIYATLRDGVSRQIRDEVFWRKDGTSFPVEYLTAPLRDENREIIGAVVVFSDITERQRAEQELHIAKADAEAANRAKSEFLANMSHEIRTPMNGVIGMTDLLLETSLTNEQREFAEVIRSSADALLTVINDILDFSKIEAGKLTFEILDFDLIEAVEGTLDMLAGRAQEKEIELASAIPPNLPTRLRGDPARLRQILTNLVGNAIKFTSKGEVVVSLVKQSETDTSAEILFNVKDTGVGVSPEAQTRLFQVFSQANSSTTRKYGGTGLGLVIAKQLATMMHGQIGVHSEMGKGSTFWFTVQLEKQTGNARSGETHSRDLFDLRVLVVDDNATNRQILDRQLMAWKAQTGSAGGSYEALEILRAAAERGQPYDMALLDLQMPEMDGLTLAHAIKKDPSIAATRLIILTSFGQALSAIELKEAGIEACLVKPVKQSRLFDCLATAMDKAAPQTALARSATSATSATIYSKPNPQIRNARILLAENNTVNQMVALGQLQNLQYEANAVCNGLEVLKALERVSYDIIFMDCQMPEMDGYEATRAIRRREQNSASPCPWRSPVYIIAITANAMQGDREKCLAAGMDDYLSKPVRPSELQAALERWKVVVQNRIDQETFSGNGLISGPKLTTVDVVVTETVGLSMNEEKCPVDMQRFLEVSGDSPDELRQMIDLYLGESDNLAKKLGVAIQMGAAKEVERLAHTWFGASGSCGMIAIVPTLRELEDTARSGHLCGAEQLYADAGKQLNRIQQFLTAYLEEM
jgi:PAS domain S-box-containing protein